MTEDRQRLFGDDLLLAERAGGLDLVSDWRGDLALGHGNENVLQALTLRLKVRKGDLAALGWPTYGSRLHELIGEPNNPRTHAILMAHARTAIEQDPRVSHVIDVRTVPSGERHTVTIVMDVQLIDRKSPFNLVYAVDLEAS